MLYKSLNAYKANFKVYNKPEKLEILNELHF